MRVAPATVQLALPDPALIDPVDRWWAMPEPTRAHVLGLLAALIARGVLIDTGVDPVVDAEVASSDG
jgi:hypothetical protein